MKRIGTCWALISTLLVGACEDRLEQQDASVPDARTIDGGADLGAEAPDAGGGCLSASIEMVGLDAQQDVQTIYSARLSTNLEANIPDLLVFNFININERFGPMALGTFSLSDAPNDNRGTCAECLSIFVDQVTPNSPPTKVFFQSAGSIRVDADPRTRVFKGRVSGLVLVEVTIDPGTLESTPVPDGQCVEVDDFDVDFKFIPPQWSCAPELYQSGGMCNCDCGAPDPDCSCDPFANPNCPPVIEDDCPQGTVCTSQGCQASCDPFSTPAQGCSQGELCAISAGEPSCIPADDRVNGAQLGQTCEGLGILVEYCAVSNTVPAGVCDDIDSLCRPLCASPADCGPQEQCYTFSGAYGYCRPGGDIPPEEWSCDPEEYSEGTACHCGCGATDPDCAGDELPVIGCQPGETCPFGQCE